MRKILLNAMLLSAPLMFSPWVFAAANVAAEVQTRQGMVASEHAGHGERAGMGGQLDVGGSGKSRAWTSYPTLKTKMGGENRDSRGVILITQNIETGSIGAYSNDVKAADMHRQLPFTLAGARLDKPESGGFHWLAAREEQADKVRVASTVYFFSNPGRNPTAMFMQQKHELEIIPRPFPREHSRYRANEDWKFLVRFNSKPLINQKVHLETRNGTKTELLSDAQGVISVHLPDDFKVELEQKNAVDHSHVRRSADFVLATEHAEGGKTYLTGFNSSYGPNAFDQRSLAMGLGFTLLGMMGATPLLRQRKDKNKLAAAPATAEAGKNKDA